MVGKNRLRPSIRRLVGATALPRWLLAGATLLLTAAPAAAQTPQVPADAAAATPAPGPGPDGLDQNSFFLEADKLTQDNKTKIATAEGHVEARYRGRTLRAETVIYDTNTQVATAKGNVVIINPDGTAEFAKELTLDKDLTAGVALGFSARLKNRIKIAADSLIRRTQDITELNRAIYTPCDICAKNGEPKTPTWSIQASKVVEDRANHLIYYHNAVIRVLGVPVLYLPVMWNPDPDTETRSGFLAPFAQYSNKRGLSYEQPYLWVISPSQDLTIAPEINTNVNPFLTLDYRALFYSGFIRAKVGVTDEYEFDNFGNRVPGSAVTPRSYILANGAFDLNNDWQWGFSAERASDDTLFDRYDIHGVYDSRGLFDTDSRRLLSQVYAVRQDQDSYLSISMLDFQGLRVNDVNGAMPFVGPLVEGRFEPDQQILGGRLLVAGQGAIVTRGLDLQNPSAPGEDSRTGSAQADWRRAFTLSNGLRVEPFLDGRVDAYNITNQYNGLTSTGAISSSSTTTVRALPSAGLDLSYPMIRTSGDTTIVLEPLAEGVIAPRFRANPDIPDEDSRDFNFDGSSMFNPNIDPGIDVYNEGPRLDTGGRATISWGDGHEAYAFFGRSFRPTPQLNLPPNSGFVAPTSDWIFETSVSPMRGISAYDVTEVSSVNGQLQHEELGFNLMTSFLQGYARYIHDITDPIFLRHNIDLAGDLYVTKHWGLAAYATRDLDQGVWSRRDIGVFYQNDCARIELVYHYEAGFAELGPPSTTVLVRLTLATLGQQGYRDTSDR